MATALAPAGAENRLSVREDVHYRARAICPEGKPVSLLIVNVSAGGLMARTEARCGMGERLRVTLPIVGVVTADIRWALGGRIGCELDRPIDLPEYRDMLAVMKGR